jgi:hypothetical protein
VAWIKDPLVVAYVPFRFNFSSFMRGIGSSKVFSPSQYICELINLRVEPSAKIKFPNVVLDRWVFWNLHPSTFKIAASVIFINPPSSALFPPIF